MRIFMAPDYREGNPYQELLSRALQQEGVSVQFPVGYRRGLPLTRAIRSLAPRPQAVHLHWSDPYLKGRGPVSRRVYAAKHLVDLRLAQAATGPLVWTVHNLVSHESPDPSWELGVAKRVARLADRLIAHTRANRDVLAEAYGVPLEKFAIIPHGHYRDWYPPRIPTSPARKSLGIPADRPVLLHFGMLRPYKGVEGLLDAWRRRSSALRDWLLVIAGKPVNADYEAALRSRAGDDPAIDLRPGFLPDDQIPLYYSAAEAVVLPFTKILSSGSLLLAMSYDCPVVAPNQASFREVLAFDSPLLYDPDSGESHAALGGALERLSQCDLQRVREQTRDACDRYDWRSVALGTIACYGGRG